MKRICLIMTMATGAAWAQQESAATATGGLQRARLYGVMGSTMLNNLNRNDARAALKAWLDLVGQQRGFLLDSKIDIVDTAAEIRDRAASGSAELTMMSITDFLEIESSGLLVPIVADARGGQQGALYPYVLLVNPSSGITTVAGLRGKKLGVSSRAAGKTGGAWLDVLLSKEKLGRAAVFFASVKTFDKPQACILPLFFGAADACVVDEVSLNLAKEMNPQLGQLRVLSRSRPLLDALFAVPSTPHPHQKDLIDGLLALGDNPRGRQLLMVFKTDRIVRITTGDLESSRELWKDYYRLPGASANPTAGAGAPGNPRSPNSRSTPMDRSEEKP